MPIMAFFSISSVKSMPITLPFCIPCLDAKKTSIPAPEPKSTTVSPSFRLAKLRGIPQPSPRIEDPVLILMLCDYNQ